MYCIDWDKEKLSIYGSARAGTYGSIDIMAVPCQMGQPFWASKDFATAPEYCEWNHDEAMSYMKNLQLTVMYNRGRFK